MQKKIKKSLAAILSLLMIMTAIPFTPVAVATDGADTITEKDCTEHADTDGNEFCDVCGELINAKVITADSDGMVYVDGEALEITGYYNNDLILPAGNYKLTGDVTSAYYISAREGEVTLDLNGYVWDMRDGYLLLSNQFSLYDTSDAGTGKLTSSWGMTVYISQRDTQCGTFNLYSGTVENTSTDTDANIISAVYGDANLYGGKIKGNAYAFFNYMFSDLTINLDGTVIENGEGYAQVKSDLMDGDTPKTVIDVTDYTGESFTVDAEIDEEGKIKIFEGIKSAQEAENYQINFLTKYGEVYCEKTEYDEATGEKYIYVLKNAFTQQPYEKNNYTVEFNNPDASFQWYEVNENEIGKYTTEEGDHLFPYDFKKGDILKVTTASEIEYAVIEAGSYRLRLDKENKTATVRIDEDETIEIFTRFVDSENDVELNFSVIKEISLEGETGKTLQTPEHEKSYWCKATVGAKVYPSNIVFICYTHNYDENGKCYYCEMQAAAKVTDKDGNKLSGSPYKTFAEAVTAASASEGSILTLLDDITLTETLNIGGAFTIDLNGKTLNCTSGNTIYIYPNGDYVLTVEDFSESKNGVLKSETGKAVNVSSGGKLILNSGTVTAENDYAISAVSSGFNYSLLEVHGGTVNGNVFCYGDSVITGGTFNGTFGVSSRYISNKFSGGIFNGGIKINSNKSLNKVLADGCHFRNAEGKITDGSSNSIEEKVTIEKGADLADAVVTVDKTEFVYNGQHQAPDVTVTIGGKTLTENVDYVVNARRWENGVPVQWFYYVDAGVYTSVITGSGDYTGTVKKEFVIKPATVDIIWEGDSFYYTGNPHKLTAKYVDVNGDENPAAITQNKTNTEIGKYIATAVVEDSNYTVNGATINHAYEIKWYDGAPDATFSGTKGENGWYTSEVTVTAPEGYAISTLADGIYGSEVTFGNEEKAVYYLKQAETGYIAKIELGKFAVDLNDPEAEITMADNKWNSFLNTVTFGKFFKETQSVTITASDKTSGIARIEYIVATEEITDFENAEWIEHTDAFNIEPNTKNIIYAKATDNAGRYVIVNSDGIVVYSDSQVTTADTLTYTLTTIEDVEYSVDFKGNTVDYVKINNDELNTDEYEVTENSIIIKGEYVENLAADVVYEIIIGINPMGETYADGDAPAEMKAYLAVEKITGSVIITNDISKVYDGTPVEAPQYETIGTGEVTIKYTSAIGEPQYTDVVPTEAGTYFVVAEIAETNKSTYDFGVAEFTIAKADSAITAAPTPNTLTYKGEAQNLVFAGEAMYGTMVYSLDGTEYSETIPQGTDAGDYTVYYKVAGDANHNDTEPATVIVTINAKDISDGFIILGDPLTYNGKEQTQTVEKVIPTGTAPEATYTVSGNKATNVGVYLLTVTGTGNFTGEAKIAFEIAVDVSGLDYSEADGYYWSDVKSTDKDRIEYVYNQIRNASTEYADEDKKAEWNTLLNNCNEMLLMIKSVTDHLESFKEEVAGYDIDTVTSDDYDYLEGLYESEGQWLYDHGENYTDEEIKEFSDTLDDLQKLKIRISDVAKEITRITNAVNGYDEETVKSSDKANLEQLKADIKALTDGQNITDGEREKLAELDAKLDDLLKKIADTQAEIDELGKNVDSYTEDSVKSSDSDELAQLKEDIQTLIDSGNTTENEKTTLEDMIKDIEGLEDKIAETEEKLEEIKGIENNYNPETVTSDDKAAIEDKIAEIEAVNPDNLTDEQKAEYDEIKAGFEALLEEIAAAEKTVADIGIELEMFDEKRVTIFWEDDIEALKAKIDELLADENMGEAEKAKLNEYKAQAEKLIEIINTPVKYFSLRFFYFIWDSLHWLSSHVIFIFNWIVAMF